MACRKKLIPQFACTYYLGMFLKVHSTILSSQTLDVVPVERTQKLEHLQKLAPWLVKLKSLCPWFNDEIRSARKAHRRLERKWECSKLEIDHQEYSKQNVELSISWFEEAKRLYYLTKIDDSCGDQKKLFDIVNGLLHKSQKSVLPTSDSDESLANTFSQYLVHKIAFH